MALSLWAWLMWPSMYPEPAGRVLPIQVEVDARASLQPGAARELLSRAPQTGHHDTQLSEQPVWFSFVPQEPQEPGDQVIEFPSRHLTSLACWQSDDLLSLGATDRENSSGQIRTEGRGFSLPLKASASAPPRLLCRGTFVGPARLTVEQWPAEEFRASVRTFDHNSGLLDGGLTVLAAFVLITALINRNSSYLLFAVWLVINLRMGALSAGWDTQWLDVKVPVEWLQRMRLITVALIYVVTVTLYKSLFKEHLAPWRRAPMMRFTQWSCFPILACSLFLGFSSFLPLLWFCASVTCATLVFYLLRILLITRSSVAAWYGGSIAVMLSASLYEVIAAALGYQSLIGSVNSVTAALSSSLLASLAIAAQMRDEHTSRLQAQAKLQQTYEAIPIGLFTLDKEGAFLSANPALVSALSPAVLAPGSNRWEQYFGQDSWLRLQHMLNARIRADVEVQSGRDRRHEAERRFLVKATLAGDRIEGSLEDITERSRATAHLQFLAHHDALTKALNRSAIQNVLEEAVWNVRPGAALALAYLDLDRFKLINHLYGHAAGDEVLRQVVNRVTQLLSSDMAIGRVGGDEFLLTMPQTRIAHATLLCQGILNSIGSRPYKVGDRSFHVRGSIGLIEVTPGTETKDAISTADRACRDAKASHGNHLVVFEKDSRLFHEHEEEMRLVEQLSAASEAPPGLFLEMQPIMSLSAPRQSLNFEVLLRMRDAKGALIPTARLISAAEFSGRMGVIDRWVLSQTLGWIEAHQPRLGRTLFICINLSGASLNDERFVHEVFQMLERHASVVGSLCLEITESVALHDLDNTRRFVERVRSLGAKVALDDFGAGYTSFSYLRDLPADLLKIDGNFIVNMNQHPANVAIVEAIVSLARNLGMKTIAEWAEDPATVQTLADIGVDYVQGFVISKSRDPADLLDGKSSADFIEAEAMRQLVNSLEEARRQSPEPQATPDRHNRLDG